MANIGVSVAKLLVILSNFIFFLFGCGLVVLAAVFLTSRYHRSYQDTLGDSGEDYTIFVAVLLAVGFFILFVSFLGCCGAYREHRCMLATFATIIAILLLTQIAVAIAAFVRRDTAIDVLEESAKRSIGRTSEQWGDRSIYHAWNETQFYYHCCGVRGSGDWSSIEGSQFYERPGLPNYPDHCCRTYRVGCAARGEPPWPVGCLDKVLRQFDDYGLAIGLTAILIGLVQVLGVALACCLMRVERRSSSGAKATTEY